MLLLQHPEHSILHHYQLAFKRPLAYGIVNPPMSLDGRAFCQQLQFVRFTVTVWPTLFADPGKARDCSKNTVVGHCFIYLVSNALPPLALHCCQAQLVRNGASSHNRIFCTFLGHSKSQGYQNCIMGSKVVAILLNGWILPIGAIATERSEINGDTPSSFHIATSICTADPL